MAPTEGAWESAKDTWISPQIRSDLVFDSQVRSVNYTIDTVNGSVYLIGSARTQAELDRVTDTARNVPDVKRVVSYVEIRPGAPVAAAAGRAAAADAVAARSARTRPPRAPRDRCRGAETLI